MATSVSLARGHAVAARRRRRARAQPQPSVAADWRSCADCTGLRHPMGAYPSLQRRGSPLVHVDAGRWRIRNRRLRHRTWAGASRVVPGLLLPWPLHRGSLPSTSPGSTM